MEQIFDYIAFELCNPTAALNLIDEFKKAFDNACAFPDSYPLIQNEYVKDKTLRKILIKNYIIFYRTTDKDIQIIRVIYGMRNYEEFL